LFAVTHFDHYYTPGCRRDNPDENKVKQFVSEAFEDVQEDNVFPVCGRWVLHAYLLKNRPSDSHNLLVVKRAYEDYKWTTESSFSDSKQNQMIDTLLEIGGLKKLETRYY